MFLFVVDEPVIFIKGENEIVCGGTARFEAEVKNVGSLCWSITWHRRRGDDIKCIDSSVEKYRGSTKRKLVINCVCKDDKGEYQALLSFESKGPDYKSRNTIRLHVIGGIVVNEIIIKFSNFRKIHKIHKLLYRLKVFFKIQFKETRDKN